MPLAAACLTLVLLLPRRDIGLSNLHNILVSDWDRESGDGLYFCAVTFTWQEESLEIT